MAQHEQDRLLEHEADGIREYDNNLPRWWLYGFYFTIVMSVIYMFYYHVYSGPDWNVLWYGPRGQENEYLAQVAEIDAMKANAPKKAGGPLTVLTDAESLAKGKAIFNGNENICYTCHREDLGGQVGPNLTDDYWIHGCSVDQIISSIKTGYQEKGMLPYGSGTKLSDEQLLQVASYIISMRGTNPPDPKPLEEGRDVLCDDTGAVPAAQ